MNIWTTLGIAPTPDTREIKRAYARRLKVTRPEDDPAAFQELHQAYQTALQMAQFVVVEPGEEDVGGPAPQACALPEPAALLLQEHEQAWEHPVAAFREEAWEHPVAAYREPVDPAVLEEQRRREREEARAQAQLASDAAFEQAQRLWGQFIDSAHVAPRWQLQHLLESGDMFNLEVREHFELFALSYCAGDACTDGLREEMAAIYRWEEDDTFIARRLPQAAGDALARLRAVRSYQQFQVRAASEPAVAALLKDDAGWRFCSTISGAFTREMQREIALVRGYHAEMLHFKLNTSVFEEWERRVEGRRYFVETVLKSCAVGLAPYLCAVTFGDYWGLKFNLLLLLAVCLPLALGAGAAWAHYQPLARLRGSNWSFDLVHDVRHRPRWQFGWMALYAVFSTLMFIPDPPAALTWAVTAAMVGAAPLAAFANSVVFTGITFAIAALIGLLIGASLSDRPFEPYGYVACAAGVFAGMQMHYRGGADLWVWLGKDAWIARLRYAWLAGASALLVLADASPLPLNLHAALTWVWLLGGLLLSRPTIHHAAGVGGGFIIWAGLCIVLTKSSVLNASPMMSIAAATSAVAIYMLVNMSRATKHQHQFS